MRALARAFVFGALLAAAAAGTCGAQEAAGVVLLVNRADPDSLAIARHYAAVRGVPAGNIVSLDLPNAETVTWREFVDRLWNPLEAELIARGWIDAAESDLTDAIGRRRCVVFDHRIRALVVCRGVPLRVAADPALGFGPAPEAAAFDTNCGAVDSELSLLAAGNYPTMGFVRNPLFGQDRPNSAERNQVVEVSRLDGPTAADAMALVDRAVAAERAGLAGRAYVDLGGAFPEGNRWLEDVASQARALGFDTTVDRDPRTLPPVARCDAPALYFGWYAPNLNGPFALPGFRFAPGAIAMHIHSYSAATLRSATEGWCGPLIDRGAAATVGNVYEPYLELTHRPDMLFRALARGGALVDAAYYALPVLSWQCVLVGDPLYRPFAVSLAEQERHPKRLSDGLGDYVAIRRSNLLEAAGQPAAAVELLRRAWAASPNDPVLGIALGERLLSDGKAGEAADAVGFASRPSAWRTQDWALVRAAAQILVAAGRPGAAVSVYHRILSVPELPAALRSPWLVEARRAALAAGDPAQAAAWQRDYDDLVGRVIWTP